MDLGNRLGLLQSTRIEHKLFFKLSLAFFTSPIAQAQIVGRGSKIRKIHCSSRVSVDGSFCVFPDARIIFCTAPAMGHNKVGFLFSFLFSYIEMLGFFFISS